MSVRKEVVTGPRITCELCRKTASWEALSRWWVGVDQERHELFLCDDCQRTAYYCDICQSIHQEGASEHICNYAICPGCERLFRAHAAYPDLCPRCLASSRTPSDYWRIRSRLSRCSCA